MTTSGYARIGAILGACLPAAANAQPGFGQQIDPSSARLISGTEALVAGEVNTLGLAFELEPGWHLYFDGQNDTGFAPDPGIEWPEGWELVAIEQPVPVRYVAAGDLLDHVLEGEPVLLLRVRVPEDEAGRTVRLRGDSSWLVCKEACLMDDESVELEIPVVASGSEPGPGPQAGVIEAGERASAGPEPDPARGRVVPDWLEASWEGESVSVRASGEARQRWVEGWRIEFYPGAGSVFLENLLRTGSSGNGALSLRPEADPGGENPSVRGVVAIRSPEGVRYVSWIQLNREEPGP
ncbi:MAG: protein-disulfide reductase DsbD domain-containing protein [Phycisphaerales bacterium JB040]